MPPWHLARQVPFAVLPDWVKLTATVRLAPVGHLGRDPLTSAFFPDWLTTATRSTLPLAEAVPISTPFNASTTDTVPTNDITVLKLTPRTAFIESPWVSQPDWLIVVRSSREKKLTSR